MNDNKPFPLNADTLNAVVNALGAVVLTLASRLPKEDGIGLANDLARLAQDAERRGDLTLETLLMDLQRAARIGAS